MTAAKPDEAELPDLKRARTFWVANRFDEAVKLFAEVAAKYPENLAAQVDAARALGHRHEIKRAIENLLGSKVESVRTSIAHGKVKRQGRFAGRRSDWKKAYVRLAEGAKMPEFLEGA